MAKSKKAIERGNSSVQTQRNTQSRRKRRRRKSSEKLPSCSTPLVCFDSETTNHGELLELSIFDASGEEVYHKYFRPHAKAWPSDIHHITPETVADCKRFIAHRGEVSHLLNGAKYFLGCAISNDLHNLRRHGVSLNEGKTSIDIQTWYWLLNDSTDRREKYQTGLAAIGQAYGLDFGGEQQHSATGDTRLTLACFNALVEDFNRQFPDPTGEEIDITDDGYLNRLIARFNIEYKRALQVYKMRNAGGYVSVMRREQGYSLKFHRFPLEDSQTFVLSTPVEDRDEAEKELRIFLKPRELRGLTGIYDLIESDFEYLKNYSNEINEEKYLGKSESRTKTFSKARLKLGRRSLKRQAKSAK